MMRFIQFVVLWLFVCCWEKRLERDFKTWKELDNWLNQRFLNSLGGDK